MISLTNMLDNPFDLLHYLRLVIGLYCNSVCLFLYTNVYDVYVVYTFYFILIASKRSHTHSRLVLSSYNNKLTVYIYLHFLTPAAPDDWMDKNEWRLRDCVWDFASALHLHVSYYISMVCVWWWDVFGCVERTKNHGFISRV